MTTLVCPRCDQEIAPGTDVDLVYPGDGEPRIVLGEDMLVTHATCPAVVTTVSCWHLTNGELERGRHCDVCVTCPTCGQPHARQNPPEEEADATDG